MVGSLTLRPLCQRSEFITLDAHIRGRLQAELRDTFGRPLQGFELNSCLPVRGDSPHHVLTWRDAATSAAYRYDTVSLRIEVEDGVLYSVEV